MGERTPTDNTPEEETPEEETPEEERLSEETQEVAFVEETFIELQAILAGLPIHAVPSPEFSRSCAPDILVQCGGQRGHSLPQLSSESRCATRIEARLNELAHEYPDYKEVLGRLTVEWATLDMVCLVDRKECRLFTAARGTDRNLMNPLTTPRDWTNNLRIACGFDPARASALADDYRKVRAFFPFPQYSSFGCGHSLGGTVVMHLARAVEDDRSLAFARIDVFNTASSPAHSLMQRPLVNLKTTPIHAHRVNGDWASWGMCHLPPTKSMALHTHPVKPNVRERHSLRHFLPEKAMSSPGQFVLREDEPGSSSEICASESGDGGLGPSRRFPPWILNVLSCAGVRSKLPPELPPGGLRQGGVPSRPASARAEVQLAVSEITPLAEAREA